MIRIWIGSKLKVVVRHRQPRCRHSRLIWCRKLILSTTICEIAALDRFMLPTSNRAIRVTPRGRMDTQSRSLAILSINLSAIASTRAWWSSNKFTSNSREWTMEAYSRSVINKWPLMVIRLLKATRAMDSIWSIRAIRVCKIPKISKTTGKLWRYKMDQLWTMSHHARSLIRQIAINSSLLLQLVHKVAITQASTVKTVLFQGVSQSNRFSRLQISVN